MIGSNSFIPGFEEQLIGIKAGENRTVKASFPPNYLKADLAGKEAEFEVTAKSIDAPGEVTVDDEFAKQLGMELLAKLRDAVKDRIAREHAGASRNRLKRQLLDALDETPQVRAAADAGRAGIRQRLADGRERPEAAGPHASPTKAPPRRRRRPNIARSPSAACGLDWSSPRSATRTRSR